MIERVALEQNRLGDVMSEKLEIRIRHEVLNVALRAGKKVIESDNLMTLPQEHITEVRTNKARTP
jgi:hypothetical protein